jgi:hypothetical protein
MKHGRDDLHGVTRGRVAIPERDPTKNRLLGHRTSVLDRVRARRLRPHGKQQRGIRDRRTGVLGKRHAAAKDGPARGEVSGRADLAVDRHCSRWLAGGLPLTVPGTVVVNGDVDHGVAGLIEATTPTASVVAQGPTRAVNTAL